MNPQEARILIIDDDIDVLNTARMLLKQQFAEVHTEQNPAHINQRISREPFDVVLLDMNFKKGEHDGRAGLYWLDRILEINPQLAVVPITAYGDIDLAVEAVKKGAVDFITKPWKNEKLLKTIETALQRSKERKVASKTDASTKQSEGQIEMIGQSLPMCRVDELIDKVAATDANVLILGENGTGKEGVARLLHQRSHRCTKPFVQVDLGAISETLFESELFGHVKGAFTDARSDKPGKFEIAAGGTLFLDEIGNLSLPLQAKLLTVLQNKRVSRVGANEEIPLDARLICATNMSLYAMSSEGGGHEYSFRQDLLYRINTVEIKVPPLRERTEDISLLVEHFIEKYARKYNKPRPSLSAGVLSRLERYPWPGNVRELEHAVERAIILNEGETLNASSFVLSQPAQPPANQKVTTLDENEKLFIKEALERNQGNITQTAKELGITRTALYRRLDKFGL